jgi:hypothetical protein
MTEEELQALREITSTAAPLSALHPLKLDRWWRAIVGAPDAIYMQMGSEEVFTQVDSGTRAVVAMRDLLGGDVPISHHEVAQRHIKNFRLHVPRDDDQPVGFVMSWDKEKQNWEVHCALEQGTTKIVKDLEHAVEVCRKWAPNVKEVEAEDDEIAEESEAIEDGV